MVQISELTRNQELTSMSQEHLQSDPILLLRQDRLIPLIKTLQDLHIPQLRRILLHHISIVQRQLSLLHKLHTRDTSDHFCTASDPEDALEIHFLFTVCAPHARSVREDLFAIAIDANDYTAGDLVARVFSCCVDRCDRG